MATQAWILGINRFNNSFLKHILASLLAMKLYVGCTESKDEAAGNVSHEHK